MFHDRDHAAERLAEVLGAAKYSADSVVVGIPRGGVVVAARVAKLLGLPLGVAPTAKVGAPGHEEFAIGAVGADGEITPNPHVRVSRGDLETSAIGPRARVAAQMARLEASGSLLDVSGRDVIVVDDGAATGLTAIAAVKWLRRSGASRITVAIPVASESAVRDLELHADRVVAAEVPEAFRAVGCFYEDFSQVDDLEVDTALATSRQGTIQSETGQGM